MAEGGDRGSSPFLEKNGALYDKHFSGEMDDLTAILKAHLLVEELLRDFSSGIACQPQYLREARLTFKQIARVSRAFLRSNNQKIEWIWTAIDLLNKTRNLYAHALEPSESELQRSQEALRKVILEARRRYTEEAVSLPLKRELSYMLGTLHAYFYMALDSSNKQN